MTLTFIGGAYNAASGTKAAFDALSNALVREGFPPMASRSGDREESKQLEIWHARMTLSPGTRKVYGTASWQGKKWYRIHPDKVGVPGSSNHEKRRSNDLAYPYNDTSTAAHKRAQVFAPKYGITWEGKNFNEPWHWTFWGPLGAINLPSSLTPPPTEIKPASEPEEEDDDMKPTVHARLTDKIETEWMLGHPNIGVGLEQFTGSANDKTRRPTGEVTVFRGFMVTANRDVFVAWARTYGKGTSEITSRTDRDGYIAIQRELSRFAVLTSLGSTV